MTRISIIRLLSGTLAVLFFNAAEAATITVHTTTPKVHVVTPKVKGLTPLSDVNLQTVAPYDQGTHQGTGRRIWKPVQVEKTIDSASPKLDQSAVTNETATSINGAHLRAL